MAKLSPPEKHDRQITIKLTQNDYDKLVNLALKSGMKKSTLIRLILEQWFDTP